MQILAWLLGYALKRVLNSLCWRAAEGDWMRFAICGKGFFSPRVVTCKIICYKAGFWDTSMQTWYSDVELVVCRAVGWFHCWEKNCNFFVYLFLILKLLATISCFREARCQVVWACDCILYRKFFHLEWHSSGRPCSENDSYPGSSAALYVLTGLGY